MSTPMELNLETNPAALGWRMSGKLDAHTLKDKINMGQQAAICFLLHLEYLSFVGRLTVF